MAKIICIFVTENLQENDKSEITLWSDFHALLDLIYGVDFPDYKVMKYTYFYSLLIFKAEKAGDFSFSLPILFNELT
jgi:hypothetical protein